MNIPAGAAIAHRRLNICIATETYAPEINGVAMTIGRLAAGLVDLGHSVQLICPRRRDRDCGQIGSGIELLPVAGLPLPRYRDLRFGLPAGRTVRAHWRRQAPDIVYVATQGPLGWSVAREARCRGIPLISGFHTNFHVYCRHYGLKALEPLVLAWLRRFHRRTDATLVPTDDLCHHLHALGVGNARVLGRGVDTELFDPGRRDMALRQSWGAGAADTVVLYVGRLAPEKNLQLATQTYRALQGVDDGARFVLVGDGPLAASLRAENPDFIFCGMQTGTALAQHYASGDLFLFPSLTETFGNVLLEAMASGLAVVAYDCAAAGQHINSYYTGVTAEPGNETSFLHGALTLCNDRALMSSVRDNARLHALSQGWDSVTARFAALLLEYVGQSASGPPGLGCDPAA